jgi:hypothetical protein
VGEDQFSEFLGLGALLDKILKVAEINMCRHAVLLQRNKGSEA